MRLPYYTQLAQKSKVSGPGFALIFCFAQILSIHSCIFSLLHRMFQLWTPSPDAVLALGLLDPAQLIGDDQLFQVVHLLAQHLALVHVLDQDAAVLLFEDVLPRDVPSFSQYRGARSFLEEIGSGTVESSA